MDFPYAMELFKSMVGCDEHGRRKIPHPDDPIKVDRTRPLSGNRQGYICLWKVPPSEIGIDGDDFIACLILYIRLMYENLHTKDWEQVKAEVEREGNNKKSKKAADSEEKFDRTAHLSKDELRRVIRFRAMTLHRLHRSGGIESVMRHIVTFFTVRELAELKRMGPIGNAVVQEIIDFLNAHWDYVIEEKRAGRVLKSSFFTKSKQEDGKGGETPSRDKDEDEASNLIMRPLWWDEWDGTKSKMVSVTEEDIRAGGRYMIVWQPDDGVDLSIAVIDDVTMEELLLVQLANMR